MLYHWRPRITPASARENERILETVERLGGGYVWETEIFTVTLMDVAVQDEEAAILVGLVGVQQIALNGSRLSYAVLERIARIPGLRSLVLSAPAVSETEVKALKRLVPEILVVEE